MKKNKKISIIIAITIIVTAVLTFLSTSALFALLLNSKLAFGFYNTAKLSQALSTINKHYYYEIDKEALVDDTLKAMAASLGDPYTAYMDSSEYSAFTELLSGTYAGIGAIVLWDDELQAIIIAKPFDGSPAQKSGLEKGDKVLKIDGNDFSGVDFDTAVSKMKGEKGSHVLLTVLKAGSGETVTIDVIRDDIQVPSVDSELKGENGYLAISMFDMRTGDEFKQHLSSLLNKGAKSLILDLRDNGGGLVDSVISVSDQILGQEDLIFYTENKKGKRVEYKATGKGLDMPIVVLINENTASAAELLAGALRDNLGAPLIGNNTFGKGVVQMTYPFLDGSVIKLTVEKYFTPNGYDINNVGIMPDHEVDLVSSEDEQLKKAVEVIEYKKTAYTRFN